MARYLYINPDPSTQDRATQLGCGWIPIPPDDLAGVVTGKVPCAVITGAGLVVVVAEPTTPQAVTAAAQPVVDAEAAAAATAASLAANGSQIQANILSSQATIQQWIAAHPTGATLTAAQTLVVAKMLNGLCKLLLQQFTDTAGT